MSVFAALIDVRGNQCIIKLLAKIGDIPSIAWMISGQDEA